MLRIGLFGVLFGIVTFLTGMLFTWKLEDGKNQILKNWVFGCIATMGIFQVIVIPCIYLHWSLSRLTLICAVIAGVVCVASVICSRRRFLPLVKELWNTISHTPWVALLALLVIAFQMYMYFSYMHVDDDDAFYVATASTSVATDSLFQFDPYSGNAYDAFPARYVLSPFPILVAVCSKISGIHPMMMAHTVLPLILVPLSYAVFTMMGYELFHKNREKTAYFVLLAAVIQMFAYTSTHTQGTVFLFRIWQGKATLASVLLPFIFYMGMRMYQNKTKKWEWLILVLLMLACCMVSSMGIMLGAIELGIFGLLSFVANRRWKPLLMTMLCCVPNLLFAGIYLVIR